MTMPNSVPYRGNRPKREPRLTPREKALTSYLTARLPPALLSSLSLTVPELIDTFPKTYNVYAPLLLLPAHTFASAAWRLLLGALTTSTPAPTDGSACEFGHAVDEKTGNEERHERELERQEGGFRYVINPGARAALDPLH